MSKIEIQIKSENSYLQNITCNEEYNAFALNEILKKKLYVNTDDYNEESILNKYSNGDTTSLYKIQKVKYIRTKGMNFGRVFPVKSLGLCSIRREIRHTISKKDKGKPLYIDIDIVNAHFEILVQICKANNIECKYLSKYVNNRDKYLNMIMETYGVDKAKAKNIFICVLYGASFIKWIKDNCLLDKYNKKDKINTYINNVIKELDTISDIIIKNNDQLCNEVKKNKIIKDQLYYNFKSSVLSTYLQEYEIRILEAMYTRLKEMQLIINNDCVLCFDGIMIKISHLNKLIEDKYIIDVNELLSSLQNTIYEYTGFKLKLVTKDLNDDLYDVINDNDNNKKIPLQIQFNINDKYKEDIIKETISRINKIIKKYFDLDTLTDKETFIMSPYQNINKDTCIIKYNLISNDKYNKYILYKFNELLEKDNFTNDYDLKLKLTINNKKYDNDDSYINIEPLTDKINDEICAIENDNDNDNKNELLELDETNNEYDSVKMKFEKKNFKINNPVQFAEITIENKLELRTLTDLKNRYENLLYEKRIWNTKTENFENKKFSFIEEWLKDEKIRYYERIDCLPKQECPSYIYNSFDGFKVEKIKIEVNDIDITKSKIYDHLFNLCGRDEKVFDYVKMFLSRKLKNPNDLTNTALIFKSIQGVGKNIFFDWFGNDIIGSEYFVTTQDLNLLFGQFNPNLANKILVVIDEISYKETQNLVEKLKAHITQPINMINQKGARVYENKNHIGYIMFTNNENPIKIDVHDRRYLAIECISDYANNNEYITNILKEMKDKRYAQAFYNYLIKLESEYYDFTNSRPTTKFYEELKEINIPITSKFLEHLIYSEKEDNDIKYSATDLFREFKSYLEENNFDKNITTSTSFGIQMKKYKSIEKKNTSSGIKYYVDFKKLKEELISLKHMKEEEEKETVKRI